jgi:hypothetical protein
MFDVHAEHEAASRPTLSRINSIAAGAHFLLPLTHEMCAPSARDVREIDGSDDHGNWFNSLRATIPSDTFTPRGRLKSHALASTRPADEEGLFDKRRAVQGRKSLRSVRGDPYSVKTFDRSCGRL